MLKKIEQENEGEKNHPQNNSRIFQDWKDINLQMQKVIKLPAKSVKKDPHLSTFSEISSF